MGQEFALLLYKYLHNILNFASLPPKLKYLLSGPLQTSVPIPALNHIKEVLPFHLIDCGQHFGPGFSQLTKKTVKAISSPLS